MRVKQAGFTLIELVAVVVLLGILAVAALPRFINLQGDAKRGVIDGIAGSIESAVTQVYAKALMQGKSTSVATANATVTDSALGTIEVAFGYPKAVAAVGANDDIVDLLSGPILAASATADTGAIVFVDDTATPATFVRIGYDIDGDDSLDDDNCYIQITTSTALNTKPVIADLATTAAGCQ